MFIFVSFKVQSTIKKSHTQDEDFDYSDNLHHIFESKEEKKLRQLLYNCHGNSMALNFNFHFSFTKIKAKQKTSKPQVLKWTC